MMSARTSLKCCKFASNNTRFFERKKLGSKARANLRDRNKSRSFSENWLSPLLYRFASLVLPYAADIAHIGKSPRQSQQL